MALAGLVEKERAEIERLQGAAVYGLDQAREQLQRNRENEAEIERRETILAAYRDARRWATGTEEHRLALQAADALNPTDWSSAALAGKKG